MRTKNIKIYSLNSDNHTELLYLYKVYCAKKQIHFKEEDFVASHRQLEKIKQCLGGTHFTFCYGFGKTVERKTKVETNVGSSPSTCSSVTAEDSFLSSFNSPELMTEMNSSQSSDGTIPSRTSAEIKNRRSTRSLSGRLVHHPYDTSSSTGISDDDNSSISTTPDPTQHEQNNTPEREGPKTRKKQSDVFMEGLKSVNVGTLFRSKCNCDMSSRLWQQRSDLALQHLISICGFSREIKEYEDMRKNQELFDSLMDLIVHVKARLMRHTKLTPSLTDDEANNPPSTIEEIIIDQNEAIAFSVNEKEQENENEERKKSTLTEQLEEKLLSNLSREGYDGVKKMLSEINNVTSNSGNSVVIRSRYKLFKDIKKDIRIFEVDEKHIASVLSGYEEQQWFKSKDKHNTALSQLQKIYHTVEERDAPTNIHGASLSLQACYDAIIAKVERSLTDYKVKNPASQITMENLLEGGFLMGVPDGAVHNALSSKNSGIVTYSITLVSHNLIKYLGINPLSALHIITQCQINGPENRAVLFSVTEERYKYFTDLKQYGETKLPFYDMADAKALYMLLGHSHWSRKHKPFLGCACGKGDCNNDNHQCVQWTDETYKEKIKKSSLRWSKRDAIARLRKEEYTISDHREWCDKRNDGICHFGVVPETYNFASTIRYDVFHGRGNVCKKIIAYIRKILGGNYENLEQFALFLQTIKGWGDYEISPWLTGDGVARLKGVHIKEFTHQIEEVTRMLSALCLPHEVKYINIALLSYTKVSKMLGKIFIDEYDGVKDVLSGDPSITSSSSEENIARAFVLAYKSSVKEFYDAGMKSFLTDSSTGDGETFYVHNLRFYMPSIIDDTYKKHKLGPGIWSMEGFEYKNAQSKRAVYTHSNRKGNLPAQSLAHLYLIYTMGRQQQRKPKKNKKKTMEMLPTINENAVDAHVELV